LAAVTVAAAVAGCATSTSNRPAAPSRPSSHATGADLGQWFAAGPLALDMARDLTWHPWRGCRLPAADRWGPRQLRDDAATGFDHSPEGAVLAMIQQQARLAAASDAAWPTVARAEAVIAPGDTAPTSRVSTGFDTTSDLPQFAGFRWVSGTPRQTVADLALEGHDGTLKTVRVTEIWTGSDWKAELPAVGSPPATPLNGFANGYQPWPGLP
jgi:hypothetical protein